MNWRGLALFLAELLTYTLIIFTLTYLLPLALR